MIYHKKCWNLMQNSLKLAKDFNTVYSGDMGRDGADPEIWAQFLDNQKRYCKLLERTLRKYILPSYICIAGMYELFHISVYILWLDYSLDSLTQILENFNISVGPKRVGWTFARSLNEPINSFQAKKNLSESNTRKLENISAVWTNFFSPWMNHSL